MPKVSIALANVRCPSSSEESVSVVVDAIAEAAAQQAMIVCFPECIIPGYRIGMDSESPSWEFLESAWQSVDDAAARAGIAVILGTERIEDGRHLITARVTNPDGTLAGFQDKVQLDPSEEAPYVPGNARRVFTTSELTFGIVICHEGWRYPETVRWAARNGAQVVFHPHFEIVENPEYSPNGYADPANTFHEKAALCRAAENTCYFATVNCAMPGVTTTSAIVSPEGELLAFQPHGQAGVLVREIELDEATGFLAGRLQTDNVELM